MNLDRLTEDANRNLRNAINYRAFQAKRRIRIKAEEARLKINESEACIHYRFFEQFDQWLFTDYGTRRNGGEGLGPWNSRHVENLLGVYNPRAHR